MKRQQIAFVSLPFALLFVIATLYIFDLINFESFVFGAIIEMAVILFGIVVLLIGYIWDGYKK